MKILQVHNYYATRGGECGVADKELKLMEDNCVTVWPFTADSHSISTMSGKVKAGAYIQMPWNHQAAKRLQQFLRSQRPDVAHVHNVFPLLSPSIYSTLRHHGIPIVQTIHNYRLVCPNGLLFVNGQICEACKTRGFHAAVTNRCMHDSFTTSALYAYTIWRGWRQNGFIRLIDHFVVLSRFSRQLLLDTGLTKSQISMVGNYVTDFAPTVSPKKCYALYLGRLSPEKGLHTLLNAARLLPDLPIKIAGSGPCESELKDALHDPALSHVQFIGYVAGQRKQLLLSEAICTIVPPECYENFPLSVVESLAQGTPVVASRIGGLPELITHRKNGLLFEAGDAKTLSAHLKKMVSQPEFAFQMATEALRDAKERFSPRRHFESLMTVYESLARERRQIR